MYYFASMKSYDSVRIRQSEAAQLILLQALFTHRESRLFFFQGARLTLKYPASVQRMIRNFIEGFKGEDFNSRLLRLKKFN
jgi:hypothetical protein